MAKKSGSKSSRSERNAGRKRAERARQHGLPVREEPPPRARAVTPEPSDDAYGEARSSDAPLSHTKKPAGIPTLAKVVGGALVLLAGVYMLSRQRDDALLETKPAAEPAAAVSAATPPTPEVGPELVAAPEPSGAAPAPEPASSAKAPGPAVSATPPAKPVVAAPLVAQPSKPKLLDKPAVAAPAAPKPVAAPAAPVPLAAPAPVAPAAAPAPKPPAPSAPPAPAPRVDNPY